MATAAPAATARPVVTVVARDSSSSDEISEDGDGATFGSPGSGSASIERDVASAASGLVIIRTAEMDITASDVTRSMDDISKISTAAGGWVVASLQARKYEGKISIRVPADRFDDVMKQIRNLAVEVASITVSTQDFTEEFTDVSARIQTLRDTVEQLRVIFTRAVEVEDALKIQQEITRVQGDLESLEARLNFLSESSAFSLITVSMESVPFEIAIDIGEDRTAAVGDLLTYRARFSPPEGIDDIRITWNFGDGTVDQIIDRTVPTGAGNELITNSITHRFNRDDDSPFIVTAMLQGSGKAGLAEGEDKLVTTISRLPVIEVFAGENQIVEFGTEVILAASYSQPEGITELVYTWDYGDGSTSAEIDVVIDTTERSGRIETTHVHENFRTNPYRATLLITGQTELGEVEATGEIRIDVRETIGLGQSELHAGSITKDAGRVLNAVWVVVASIGLWVLYLSPIWIVIAIVVFFARRWRKIFNIPEKPKREGTQEEREAAGI